MCSLATSTACWYSPSGIDALDVRQRLVGRRRLDRHVRQRPGEVGRRPARRARPRRRRRRRARRPSRPSVGTLSIRYTRWRQWSNAASEPITAHHGVGHVAVVGRHVGQALDLADHVVAEVAHHPAVQRRQLGDHRAAVRRQQRLERGEDALVGRDLVGQRAVELDLRRRAAASVADRIAADEREAAPALAVLDRLEQEPRAVADELGVGGDRRLEVGRAARVHTGTTVCSAASAWNSSRLGRIRTTLLDRSLSSSAEGAGRSRCGRRCGRRRRLPARP